MEFQKPAMFINVRMNLLIRIKTEVFGALVLQFKVVVAFPTVPNQQEISVVVLRPTVVLSKRRDLPLNTLHLNCFLAQWLLNFTQLDH